jgi:hypothetical protein
MAAGSGGSITTREVLAVATENRTINSTVENLTTSILSPEHHAVAYHTA